MEPGFFEGFTLPPECDNDPFNLIGLQVLIRVTRAPNYSERIYGGQVMGFAVTSERADDLRYPFALLVSCPDPGDDNRKALRLSWDCKEKGWMVYSLQSMYRPDQISVEFRSA